MEQRRDWRLALVVLASLALAPAALSGVGASLQAFGRIPLPGVEGRIDHLAVDIKGNRLFVAALGNNTVEVIDLQRQLRTASIPGQHEPQGLGFLPSKQLLVVANGQDKSARLYDARDLSLRRSLPLGEDGDNVRITADEGTIFVGYGDGALAAFEPDGRKTFEVPLGGHPESFQLEARGARIFVNVPSRQHVAVIDRQTKAVAATWSLDGAAANYPMALDEEGHRLFVGCRRPSRLLVFDTTSGMIKARLDIVGDTDDLFYDSATDRLYVIGGAGAISVIAAGATGGYRLLETVPTAPGARTGLFVPALRTLFVAVPHRGEQRAEVLAFRTTSDEGV
jgi:DNA-binding beta-propeller fold protein YncE